MKLSDYVIDFIVDQGVSHIFEFIGGAIVHLLDSTYDRDDIACVSVHHEQSGAFAAEAYARINGKLGVAMATSGPGALNMLTGIGSCYFDSVPCLFITGQVNTYEYKFDRPIRQIGFQETDIVSVAKPLTKYAAMVTEPEMIRYQLEKAVWLAQSGRPGPVLLDIPMNIQRAQIEPDTLESFYDSAEYKQHATAKTETMELPRIAKLMGEAKRPLILVGGGVRAAGAAAELLQFVEASGIPVVASLMGLDAMPHGHRSFCGLIGSYGNRYSNLALANCDLLIILGSRLDSRQTGTRVDTFARAAKRIQVDIDPIELNAKVPVDIAVCCDVKAFLGAMTAQCAQSTVPDRSAWYEIIKGYREKYPTVSAAMAQGEIEPNSFMQLLSEQSRDGDIVCVDVGQHQMWAAQSFRLKRGQRLLNSGGMGAMGFALPAAIGAVKAKPSARALVIVGDGGLQVNIQELDILVRDDLAIKIVVMNNGCLGMVRQFQDLYFGGRQQSTVRGYSCPDITKVAAAYGLSTFTIDCLANAAATLQQALAAPGPSLINVCLVEATMVNPKLVVNRPIEDMSPHLDRSELQQLMLIELADEKDVPT